MKDSTIMIFISLVFVLFNILYVLALVAISIPNEDLEEKDDLNKEATKPNVCNVTQVTERKFTSAS